MVNTCSNSLDNLMQVTEAPLSGLLIIQPKLFADERGYFFESFQSEKYAALGIPPFVQDNVSCSRLHVLRGLHYQQPRPQGKLVWVSRGAVFDVVVDIRRQSPTFGKWFHIVLSAENHTQFYVPPGFAHGFCTLEDHSLFHYKCTDYYSPQTERGIAWDDSTLNIPWPVTTPILSPKDHHYPSLNETMHDHLFA